jgi:transposase-like protein
MHPNSVVARSTCSRPVGGSTDLARDLGISSQTIYLWRRQEQIDRASSPA